MTGAFRVRTLLLTAAISAAALGLAACGGGGGGGDVVVTPPPPPAAPKLEDGFGSGFATAFRAADTAEPREPSAADVIAVNATADPVPIP